jgi:glycerol-1-phosphate dehydrogenase [NAD(P)+]
MLCTFEGFRREFRRDPITFQETNMMPASFCGTVIIAEGAIRNLATMLEDGAHALIVTDDLIYSRYRETMESIVGTGHKWLRMPQFNQVISTDPHDGKIIFGPPGSPVTDVTDFRGVDIILGFGGGRSIDAAKLIAREANLDWISVPTAASHDGIASDVASVSHDGYRYSEKCYVPKAVIADLSIISKAPSQLERAGLGDIICKTSSLSEWRMAHEHNDEPFDEAVFTMLENSMEQLLADYSLRNLVAAEIDAGRAMCMVGSSRPCSGTEHAISHAMDRRAANLHGIQVAFATPLCVHYLERAGYTKYRTGHIQQLMQKHGIPTSLKDMGIDQDTFLDDIHHGLKIMEQRNRYSVLQHLAVDDADLLRTTREIGY